MKITLLIVFIVGILSLLIRVESHESEDSEEELQEVTGFFVKLISEYDKTGAGTIEREVYHLFLRDVFLKGSFKENYAQYPHQDLLLKATREFAAGKSADEKEVNIQEIYEDIISNFTFFLMERQEFKVLIDTLFDDVRDLIIVPNSTRDEKENIAF